MLVAGASLSLLAPIAAQASDTVNLKGINSYTRSQTKSSRLDSKSFNEVTQDIAKLKGRVDGLEARQNNYEAGSFSDTTTLDGKAVFTIGAIDGAAELSKSEKLTASYVYQMNLNTSFTGDDNLYVRLKTGNGWTNGWTTKPIYHIEGTSYTGALNVDKIWYTFPVGDNFVATVGPKIENYYMLAATPSVYKPGILKAFKLGSHSTAFGASTSTGFGLKYLADNGFGASVTANSKGGSGQNGLFTKEDQNKINAQVAYTDDNYHLSATYSTQRGWNSWSYYATNDVQGGAGTVATKSDSVALRGWWRPEEAGTATPSVSVGYDIINFTGHTNNIADASSYFVGLNWADMFQPDDKIGIAIGQTLKATTATAGNTLSDVDPFIWEAYYSFRPNDSIEITPGIFGGTDVYDDTEDDIFGAQITTTFKF